jgi:hypothetical protein
MLLTFRSLSFYKNYVKPLKTLQIYEKRNNPESFFRQKDIN